jgi:RNA polymerase sigma factor (sigma-70 family)
VSSGREQRKARRSYRPTVEALEALRLLSDTAQLLPNVPVETEIIGPSVPLLGGDTTTASSATWDAALSQTQLADLIGPTTSTADAQSISSGLSQLNRYLNRAWSRAGLAPQTYDDCSQAVYMTLLQSLGRDRFDSLLSEIGQVGIRDVLSRETAEGPDFFRAVDAVKKRAQRERTFQPLDTVAATAAASQDEPQSDWRSTLQEAIDHSLSPREAALIQATLQGETPAEIAAKWGIAPKTVSNEKTRAIQKLRDALTADLSN